MAKKPAEQKKSNEPTAKQRLQAFRDRITRLEEEKREIADDIKDVYKEAKSAGFDPKALRNIVKDSIKTPGQRAAQREIEAIVQQVAPHPDYLQPPFTIPALWREGTDFKRLEALPWPPTRKDQKETTQP